MVWFAWSRIVLTQSCGQYSGSSPMVFLKKRGGGKLPILQYNLGHRVMIGYSTQMSILLRTRKKLLEARDNFVSKAPGKIDTRGTKIQDMCGNQSTASRFFW